MAARNFRLVWIAALSASGCGTLDNVRVRYPPEPPAVCEAPNRIYGGVAADSEEFWGLVKLGPVSHPLYPLQLFGSFIDIPFSAVGDTLTLPVTIPTTVARRKAPSAVDQYLATRAGEGERN